MPITKLFNGVSGPCGQLTSGLTQAGWLLGAALLGCGGLLITPIAHAADNGPNLEFKGTLIEPPPCTLGGDDVIRVKFGDKIGVNKVASGVYRQPVPLELQCEGGSQAWQLQLTVKGNAADFDGDNATVKTAQQKDLGVKLFLGGKPFPLDKAMLLNGSSLPAMEALLTQRAGGALTEGEFSAQATLRAEYQ